MTEPKKFRIVIITVLGGVAEVRECPEDVDVEIIDLDNVKESC